MNILIPMLRQLAGSERGVSTIEYALLASLIALVCALTVTDLGSHVDALYVKVCRAFPGSGC
ncbi:MAG TPA: Flp family type IVb pilin [Rhodocyclaceae bacterium]